MSSLSVSRPRPPRASAPSRTSCATLFAATRAEPPRRGRASIFVLAAVLLVSSRRANGGAAGAPIASTTARHDLSAPLAALARRSATPEAEELSPNLVLPNRRNASRGFQITFDVPSGPSPDAAPAPGFSPPLASFEGLDNRNNLVPPDTVGDVGPHHYVQWVNASLAVWDKQGNLLFGPVNGNTLWSGFGGTCESYNRGDAVVQYDALADRWLLSQLAFVWPTDFHQCIAVSATDDPTGAYYRYDFPMSATNLNDYPKFGVWPDAYYMAINEYEASTDQFRGQGAIAFERSVMLAGGPARMIRFNLYEGNSRSSGALPSDLDGPVLPPAGAPNYFVAVEDDAWGWPSDRLELWRFHVDWSDPGRSTFGSGGQPDAVIDLDAAGHPFDSNLCGYARNCIPQPGGAFVDALSDRLMYRLAYRNFGDHESLVVNHTVNAGESNHAGIRWYEIRDPGAAAPVLYQAGTFAPDADHRWLGSAAMDGKGNLALAYSVSGTGTYPSIRYVGRQSTDPPGTLPQVEGELMAGSGFQTGASRWGDYSALSVDPTDDCTFWYTQEYYATTSGYSWRTRIGSFRFTSCGGCPLVGAPLLLADRETAGIRLTWSPARNAAGYDVMEGSLPAPADAEPLEAPLAPRCVAEDLYAHELRLDEPDPPAGAGSWYLVRGKANECLGAFDDLPASSLPLACP